MHMRNVLFIATHDIRHQLRQGATLLWLFVMPLIFFYFIGTVTGGFGPASSSGTDPIRLEEGAAGGFLVDELERELGKTDYVVRRGADEGGGSALGLQTRRALRRTAVWHSAVSRRAIRHEGYRLRGYACGFAGAGPTRAGGRRSALRRAAHFVARLCRIRRQAAELHALRLAPSPLLQGLRLRVGILSLAYIAERP